jgi:hypothetical protein
MSAFEGLRVLRIYAPLHPHLSLPELAELVGSVGAANTGLDFVAAIALAPIIPIEVPAEDAQIFYRDCIANVVVHHRPIWMKVMKLGRQKFIQKVSRDEEQCFRGAGLLVDPPDIEVIRWLDKVTGRIRSYLDALNLERARQAEQLTLIHEGGRLQGLGIAEKPKWVAVEDNTAGYDVLSYDVGSVEPTARLIEVKSTIISPVRFMLTRREWEQARRSGDSYHFHIWHMESGGNRLFERSAADIAPHVPSDNQRGMWTNAEIRL